MVKTSVRTVILSIFKAFIDDTGFTDYISDLPLVQFFGNIALNLRNSWLKLDKSIMNGYQSKKRDLILIVRDVYTQIEDLRDELEFLGDLMDTSHEASQFGDGGKVAEILSNALLNLAFKDILIPGVLSQGPLKHGQSINEEDQLQIITSLYLMNLTLTNLKSRPSTSYLYQSIAAKIFTGVDVYAPIYQDANHRQQMEVIMDKCFLVEGFAGRGTIYDFKMKKKPLKVYDLTAQDQRTYEFNKYLMSNYCQDKIDHSQIKK